jgi:ABC-type nitrate/sulfonate/bicarbonate transport system permease component
MTKLYQSTFLQRVGDVYDRWLILRWTSKLLPILVMLGLWEVISGRLVPADILPPFSATAQEIVALATSPEFHGHVTDTMFRGFTGIVIATALAVPMGLAMARNERIRRNLEPIVSLTYPVPKSPLIPLVIFWLGIGNASRITLAVIGSFLPILLSAFNGADNVERELIWSARSMGVSRLEELYEVVFPAAVPTILTGVRIGLIFSFVIIVSSEMILAQTGLGVLVTDFGQFGQYAKVFAVIFWIAVIVAGIDRIYLLVTNRLLSWSDRGVSGI